MIPGSACSRTWGPVSRAIVISLAVVLGSCGLAALGHKDFDFGSSPSSLRDPALTVKKIVQSGNLGITIDYFILRVYSIDRKVKDNSGSSLILGYVNLCSQDCTIVLLPGTHSIEVNYSSSLTHGAQNLFAKFTAAPGKKYRLGINIEGRQWSPTITEVTD